MNKIQRWVARTLLGMKVDDPLPATPPPGSSIHGASLMTPTQQRMYANAVPNRFNQGFPSFNTSEDLELVSSLRNLRARSRTLIRDAGYAKSARREVVNNVIGTGVRLQPSVKTARGDLNERVNDGISTAWKKWMCAPNCHTGGALHFHDMERLLMGQVFDAGEIFLRIHRNKFGMSDVPIALEVVEPERIVDGYAYPGAVSPKSGGVRLGIETDKFKKPIAYWIRDLHPGDIRLNLEQSDAVTRVDAADVIHIYVIDRWPQTRGVPWIHAAAEKLQDINGYSEAEIIAARGSASYLGTIETPESISTLGEKQPDNTFQTGVEPGIWMKLNPGEKAQFISPNRPNSSFDPFMRYMLREVAAAVGVSYESLSHDYSQGSYSSMRVALLSERDVWRSLQAWWIRSFRHRLYLEWLNAAMLSGAIPEIDLLQYGTQPDKFQQVMFKPRGWAWVDPTKEVAAYTAAVKSGFRTVEDVVAETGSGADIDDIIKARTAEIQQFREHNLVFDTSPAVYVPAESRGQMMLDPDTDEVVPAAEVTAKVQQKYQTQPTQLTQPTAGAKPGEEEPGKKPAASEEGEEPQQKTARMAIVR